MGSSPLVSTIKPATVWLQAFFYYFTEMRNTIDRKVIQIYTNDTIKFKLDELFVGIDKFALCADDERSASE